MLFFGIAILFLLQALTGTNAVPLKPANCSAFSKVMAGNEAIGYMMVNAALIVYNAAYNYSCHHAGFICACT